MSATFLSVELLGWLAGDPGLTRKESQEEKIEEFHSAQLRERSVLIPVCLFFAGSGKLFRRERGNFP